MQFKVNASILTQAVQTAIRALSARAAQHWMEGIFIQTTNKGIELTCTDGIMTIRTKTDATILKEGCALLPARIFYDIVRHSVGDVEVYTDMTKLSATIRSLGSNTDLVCLAADEFPEVEDLRDGTTVVLSQKSFAQAVGRASFALATDEARRILTGCYMEVMPEEVRFICLDGYRFAMKKIPGKQNIKDDKQSAILPGSALLEVSRMAQDTGDKVEIVFNEKNAQVNFENTVVYLPLIPGEYINYRQILPQASSTNIKVKRSDLLSAIERAAVIATSGGRLTRLDVNEDGLTISATSEKGKSVENIEILFDGQPLTISFNVSYLQDAVRNIDTEELTMSFQTNVSPCLFTPVKGDDFIFLLLPVRTVS
ncbi:MAG TPA: DNA polymerase III subunit beta [Clostridiales bacterium]|nr:DNA polymerase III subunit beta [Clostridiales bacterium]